MKEGKYGCPQCGGSIAYPMELAGTEVSCPHCANNIFLPKIKKVPIWLIVIAVIAVAGCAIVGVLILHGKRNQPGQSASGKLSILEKQQAGALHGDPDAMYALGLIYLQGEQVPADNDEGMKWIAKAATAGNPKAMTKMGDAVYDNASKAFDAASTNNQIDPATGLPVKMFTATNIPEECFNWYRKAAGLGETNAMWKLVNTLTMGNDIPAGLSFDTQASLVIPPPSGDSIRWLKKLVKAGDDKAMVQLGIVDILGLGVEKNPEAGIKLVEQAGAAGNMDAYVRLAKMYQHGDGLETNQIETLRWLEKAANANYTDAEFQLGKFYANNEDFRSYDESFHWFSKVAQKNPAQPGTRIKVDPIEQSDIKESYLLLGKLYEKGLGVPSNKSMAMMWFKQAAQAGIPEGQFKTGLSYDLGIGGLKDKQQALEWYLKAANAPGIPGYLDKGIVESQRNIGYLYKTGDGVIKDPKEAFKWFLKAAENDSDDAAFEVAEAYNSGVGVLQDIGEAWKWYDKAARAGNKQAQISLAIQYAKLVNGPANSSQNRIMAHAWSNLAAAQGSEEAAGLRDKLTGRMTAQEITEAQKLAKQINAGE